MNIFFIASLRDKATHLSAYTTIVDTVKQAGIEVKADHVMDQTIEDMNTWSFEKNVSFQKDTMMRLKMADAVFVEASTPSLNVGYLTALAVQSGKPVVIFTTDESVPHLFKALEKMSDRFKWIVYKNDKDLADKVVEMVEYVTSNQDTRFNFFISPDQVSYLDWIARNRKISRSVYLRQLIDDDMLQNQDYQ
jgi:hypothetical protein